MEYVETIFFWEIAKIIPNESGFDVEVPINCHGYDATCRFGFLYRQTAEMFIETYGCKPE